ncbi:PfkB family carbohydrate kinase [Nocardia sp. XZ_19_385]|uniref:PfkB family carbohydrate kinase n=1 Tax=Nocardia sp. XZ_19_385 TaxID=2769488 RepID=UPI00189060D5|nr:PfkB family carbohydrate kinase [Nocardia sp. XZ_19_385]
MVPQDSATAAVRNILTRLGKHRGLVDSEGRLRRTVVDVEPLLGQQAVRDRAYREGAEPEQVVPTVVRDLARQLPPTERLIADAALSLGLLRDNPPAGADLDGFYGADLGQRREFLTENWQLLHTHLRVDPIPEPPTVRSLRSTHEHRAVTMLAGLLTSQSGYRGTATSAAMLETVAKRRHTRTEMGVVTVIGDAVIDHIYRTDLMPSAEGPPARGRFEEQIGGKGLNRAIAAARLGYQVRLLAAVGDDLAGQRILHKLDEEHVDTELVKTVRGEPTPIAAVIIDAAGGMGTIGRVDDAVRLSREDLKQPSARQAILESDALLMTFEQPLAVIEQVLEMVRLASDPPWVLVQPTPPLDVPQYLYRHLSQIDYLIGTRRELASLLTPGDRTGRSALGTRASEAGNGGTETVQQLLAMGVATVCTAEGFRCQVRSAGLDIDIARPMAAQLDESPGARAAFTAALAARLVTNDREAERADFEWATAAMAATQSFGAVAGTMPLMDEIDRIANYPGTGTAGG